MLSHLQNSVLNNQGGFLRRSQFCLQQQAVKHSWNRPESGLVLRTHLISLISPPAWFRCPLRCGTCYKHSQEPLSAWFHLPVWVPWGQSAVQIFAGCAWGRQILTSETHSCCNWMLVSVQPQVSVMQGQQSNFPLCPHYSRQNHSAPRYSHAAQEVSVAPEGKWACRAGRGCY